ncbi:MAG: hypothetical protein ACYTX0_37565, partial [Nostoc sp.]
MTQGNHTLHRGASNLRWLKVKGKRLGEELANSSSSYPLPLTLDPGVASPIEYPNNLTDHEHHELTVGSAIHPALIER